MELQPQFNEFLANIRPTDTQKEDWKSGARTLRERLKSFEPLKEIVVSTFLQGSIRRSTAIRPLGDKRPDVDIVVVTNLDHTLMSPTDAMDLFIPFLDKYYPGKWETQGRSFGITLSYVELDLVITAIPESGAEKNHLEQLYKSESVLTVNSLEEQTDWRLNKSWSPNTGWLSESSNAQVEDAPASEWKAHPLVLPDREKNEWGRTHPLAQIRWTAEKNRVCNGHYINLVRAVKWWRQQNSENLPKYPKGYPLEHLIGNALNNGTTSMGKGLVQLLDTFLCRWADIYSQKGKPCLPDHGVEEHDVMARLSTDDFCSFYEGIAGAAEIARNALASQDPQESAELWRKLFGAKFPLPGPQGGDRSGGFTVPSKPAEPQKTGRFA
ncbi:SMODS domain-containing nucleotidyltransferase [Enterobacter kobei]|uniref:SMODS domain-containing nucleotidyltransferase n=1 Tax=Enterobacter kobei TaxID=208224 RepID=UPI002FD6D8D2